jgi:glycosidase
MRKEHKALSYGSTEWIDNDRPAEVLSFKRVYEGANDVLFVGNFSDKEIKVKLANGSKYTLAPWEYIFAPQSKR